MVDRRSANMTTHNSLLKVLRIMDDKNSQTNGQTASQSTQPSKTSVELGLNFKMVKENNARSTTPTPSSTDGESSSASPDENDPRDDTIRRKLSMRAYHLPENNWCQDLGMYFKNNHLIFGICCHHRLHPVKVKHRLVILLGSLAFGLTATNAVFLYYLWDTDTDHDDTALSISLGGDVVENVSTNTLNIDISNGMALLWTVGAAAHSFFDLALWHMIACGSIKRKCCKVAGWNMAVAIVMLLVSLTSLVVAVRAYESGEEMEQSDGNKNIKTALGFGDGNADFQYLYGYGVELALSLFVYTPLVQTLLFTGILGCGVLPFVGGRPYEVRKCKDKGKNGSSKDAANGIEKV